MHLPLVTFTLPGKETESVSLVQLFLALIIHSLSLLSILSTLCRCTTWQYWYELTKGNSYSALQHSVSNRVRLTRDCFWYVWVLHESRTSVHWQRLSPSEFLKITCSVCIKHTEYRTHFSTVGLLAGIYFRWWYVWRSITFCLLCLSRILRVD